MQSRYCVNFKVAKDQEIGRGAIVTYLDETRLELIRENLILKTDFFVVASCEDSSVTISNSVDAIQSSEDQLIRVLPFLEELPSIRAPYLDENSNRYIRDSMKWHAQEETRSTYPLTDNYLSIVASGLVIEEGDFFLEPSARYGMIFASLLPEKISRYLEDK